ncbi:lysophospholipase L1-like esterase [Bradyrhizobium sp. JR6.1]
MVRSYGTSAAAVEGRLRIFVHILVLLMGLMTAASAQTPGPENGPAKPIKMVVLGDSLSAGYGLPAAAAFPVRLQKALETKGVKVNMTNAGVSGDTASGGARAARLVGG